MTDRNNILAGRSDVLSNARALLDGHADEPVPAPPTAELPALPVDDDETLGEAWIERAKPELAPAAFAGPIGEAVGIIAPESEASPIALLLPMLAMYGCMAGLRVIQDIGGVVHHLNIFGMVIGETGERKGTGVSTATRVMAMVDAPFVAEHVAAGLSSGEGLIGKVADPKPVEPGEPAPPRDARLFISEEEAGTVFTRMKRDGNSLSPVLRQAWDGRTLSTITRKDDGGLIARNPCIALIMQVTPAELRAQLSDAEMQNGFANRYVYAWTEQVRLLPFGRPVDPDRLRGPVTQLRAVLDGLPTTGALELGWSPDARTLYGDVIYPNLKPLPGRLAGMSARGAPIIRRLAGIFCVSRGSTVLSVEDLQAALAVWNYSTTSLQYVFGGSVLSPLARRMFEAVERSAEAGVGLTELRADVGGNKIGKPAWDAAIRELQASRLVVAKREKTAGRTRTTLHLAHRVKKGKKAPVLLSGGLIPLNSPIRAASADVVDVAI